MAPAPYSAIVLGATGNVGRRIVELLLERPQCRRVVIATRRPTSFTNPRVTEVIVDMARLEQDLAPYAQGIDIALAAFGVGAGSASMAEEEVRRIEIAYPLAFCRAARAGGARVAGVMTAAGASPDSRMKYVRIIGEKERAAESVGFEFLGLYRPSVILGNSNTPGVLGALMPLVHWALPSQYRAIHAHDIARAMVMQSERAFTARASSPGLQAPEVKRLEYRDMMAFAASGERAG